MNNMKLTYIIITLLFRITLSLYSQSADFMKWDHYISQSKIITKNSERINCILNKEKLNRLNLSLSKQSLLLKKLDDEYAVFSLTFSDYNKLKGIENIIWVANNKWKTTPSRLKSSSGTKKWIIKMNNIQHLKAELDIQRLYNDYFFVTGTTDQVYELLKNDDIIYVGQEALIPQADAKIADSDFAPNRINLLKKHLPELQGESVIVSVKDNFYDTTDLDLLNKHIDSDKKSSIIDAHATSMATIISGKGNSSAKGYGVAPKSMLTSSDFNEIYPELDFGKVNEQIQNHSYGTQIENFYGSLAESYDNMIYENPWQIHIFSSGNQGREICPEGSYAGIQGYSNITGNFKLAKNVLTVGAIGINDEVTDISSAGPAFDGRIKPEVVAYSSTGTSNAAALVSGVAALLAEKYSNQTSTQLPASLLKAVLINSAEYVGVEGPDFKTGYGTVNAFKALNTISEQRFIYDSISSGDTIILHLDVPENTAQLKVTLAWTDFPAPVNSTLVLMNDLDLRLNDQSGTYYYPWVLNTQASMDILGQPAVTGEDLTNNIEQISIKNPAAGEFSVAISTKNLYTPKQAFSIACQFDARDTYYWTSPLENEVFLVDGTPGIPIRWVNSFDTEVGELYISYNDANSWEILNDSVNLRKEVLMLSPQELAIGKAQLKMKVENREFLTGQFWIDESINPGVSLKCDELRELVWDLNENTAFYEINMLEEAKLKKYSVSRENHFSWMNTFSGEEIFMVRPVYHDSVSGLQSDAINFNDFKELCFFRSIFANANTQDEIIEAQIELSSTYLAEELELIKLDDFEKILIGNDLISGEKEFLFNDNYPNQGSNRYLAKVILYDGREYISDTMNIITLVEDELMFFPNPANKEGITLLTKTQPGEKLDLSIFALDGRLIHQQIINSEQDFVILTDFNPGIYQVRVEIAKGRFESKMLIVK